MKRANKFRANKFRINTLPINSQRKRDELVSNMLILQQLILDRISKLIDRQEALQNNGMHESIDVDLFFNPKTITPITLADIDRAIEDIGSP